MPRAIVEDDSPLTVRIKGDLTGTPVQFKPSGMSFAVNDLVWVEIDESDRQVVVTQKLAAL